MGQGTDDGRADTDDRGEPARRTTAEWITFAVSLLVTAALVGAALYEHVVEEGPPGPLVTVALALDRAERRGDAYYVPFTVANAGAAAAADVGIVFEVRRNEEVLEESTTTIPFLPVEGTAEGEMVTVLDPAQHEVVARVGTLLGP